MPTSVGGRRTVGSGNGLVVTIGLVALVLALAVGGQPSVRQPVGAALGEGYPAVVEAFADLPLRFVENRGQTDPQVRYAAQGPGHAFFFTPEQVVLSFAPGGPLGDERAAGVAALEPPAEGLALALRFLDADPGVDIDGEQRVGGPVHYLRGDDPAGWHTDLPAYTGVVYRGLWPGVDMGLRGAHGELKYEFRVQPGARVDDIGLAYRGADGLRLDAGGGLVIDTAWGALHDAAPVSYQVIAGRHVPVDSRYVLPDDGVDGQYGFAVGDYDPDHALIIDPGVAYSTFVGGSSNDEAAGTTVDADGNAYIVGITQSDDFPTTTGAHDRTFNGGVMDVFVAKLTADGSALAYATYLGGTPAPIPGGGSETPIDQGRAIAVDGAGNAYITGQTTSDDFPTTSEAFQPSITQGTRTANDAFVAKLNATGGLMYSTFFGGSSQDDGRSIAVDDAGNAFVFGETSSTDLPVTSAAFQTSRGVGDKSAFLAKLNAAGSGLMYSTYLGAGTDSSDNTIGEAVAIDDAGNAYLTGATRAQNFPTTPGAFQPTHPGGEFVDLFTTYVAKMNATGSDLVYSTFLGGTKRESAGGVAVDAAGNAYVNGVTQSSEFPTTTGAHDTAFDGTSKAFVAKLTADGSDLVYSTFLRGAGAALALDADTNTWAGGGRDGDAYVALLSADGSTLLDEVSFGGANTEGARSLALDAVGDVYVTGTTFSSDFPTTAGAYDRTFDGDPSIFWGDAFVVKLGAAAAPTDPEPPPPADTTETTSFSREVDKNAMDFHTVSIDAAGTVEVELAWAESRVDLSLRARDPSGSVVLFDGGSARPKTGSFSTTDPGHYRFEVVNNSDRRSDYTLRVTYPVASSSAPAPEPQPESDAVSISRAAYRADKQELRVEASSSSASATLRVYVTATDEPIGTLSGGRGEFSWPTNPANVTVRSSLGGSASRAVTED